MPKLTILTAAYGPSATYLHETADSVLNQKLPEHWEMEWIVQEDGCNPALADMLGRYSQAQYEANGLQLGIGNTRNLALSRATGDLVQVLDHDDVLLPGALATLIQRFEQHPIQWAVGAADDLLEDGTRRSWNSDLPFGIVTAGTANRWADEHGGNWPVHCAGLMIRMEILRAIGGWAGTPVDDDIVLFAALSELSRGWNEEAVTWLYRHHPDQTTRSTTWQSLSQTGRRIALQRIAALRNVGFRFDDTASLQFGYNSTDVHVGQALKKPPRSLPGGKFTDRS